jgi:ubiquinone biosynthesis protein COQ9
MTKKNLRKEFLDKVKLEVPFHGWTKEMLFSVEVKLKLDRNHHILLFPGDLKEIVTEYEKELDDYTVKSFNKKYSKKEMRVRDKVKEAVKIRLQGQNKETKILLAKLNHFYFNLNNFGLAYKNFWHTVDKIWYLAGDKATDFNYYTKRGLLFAVYKSTFLYYINSASEEESWIFLEKRIENVMKIGSVKNIPSLIEKVKDKIPFFRLRNRK